MRHLINTTKVLNEATYYGKNDILVAFEKKCAELQIQAKTLDYPSMFSKTLPEMEGLLEKMFGFQRVFLNVTDCGTCTVPAFISVKSIIPFNSQFKATRGTYGPTFNPRDHIKTYINLGFELFSSNLTPAEITAVVLHEVGHSFSFTTKNRIMMLFPPSIAASIIISGSQAGSSSMPEFLKIFNTAYAYIKYGKNFIMNIVFNCLSLLEFLPFVGLLAVTGAVARAVTDPMNLIVPLLKNDDEVFADAFATSFGYGDDLISALMKFKENTLDRKLIKSVSNDNFFKYLYYHNLFVASIAMQVTAPHPRDIDRIKNAKKFLQQAIKETSNPKLKAEMQYQLRELENLENAMLKDMPEDFRNIEEKIEDLEAEGFFVDLRTYLTEYDNQKFFNLDFNTKK